MLLIQLGASTAQLLPEHFLSTLYGRQNEDGFAKILDKTLIDTYRVEKYDRGGWVYYGGILLVDNPTSRRRRFVSIAGSCPDLLDVSPHSPPDIPRTDDLPSQSEGASTHSR